MLGLQKLIQHECKLCGSQLVRIKLIDTWSLDKNVFYGLTFGIAFTMSGYMVYRLWRFKNSLIKSIDEMENLNRRLEHIILDLSRVDGCAVNTESILNKQRAKPISKQTYKKSSASIASLSDAYETPNTSPHSTSNESSDDDDDNDDFKDPIEEMSDTNSIKSFQAFNKPLYPLKSALKKRKHDDDYVGLLSLPLADLNNIIEKAELSYNEVGVFLNHQQ
jgi:hypothetical protein